jgi:hypothetical protein
VEDTVLAGAAAVVGGAVTVAGGETCVELGGLGGEAHAARRARTASAAGFDRSRRRCFVTKMGASVAKPTKATPKFGISAAL